MRYASPIAGLLLNTSAICNTGFQGSPLLFLILMPVITCGSPLARHREGENKGSDPAVDGVYWYLLRRRHLPP